jgi:hypothetical protein
MRAEFLMGKTSKDSPYIPKRGETIQYDRLGDGTWLTIHVGDGKTQVKDLPAIADYDLRERVRILEEKIAKLENDRRV